MNDKPTAALVRELHAGTDKARELRGVRMGRMEAWELPDGGYTLTLGTRTIHLDAAELEELGRLFNRDVMDSQDRDRLEEAVRLVEATTGEEGAVTTAEAVIAELKPKYGAQLPSLVEAERLIRWQPFKQRLQKLAEGA